MGKHKRDQATGEPTTSLVGFFTTPTEKKLIEAVKPEGQSMSDFCRESILQKVNILAEKKIKEQTETDR